MARSVAHFLLLLMAAIAAVSCTTNVYVRTPGVCPRDIDCLAQDQLDVSAAAAKAREAEYVKRVVGATVTVRGMHYNGEAGKSAATGTGTIIGSKGYVLTAYHLIQGAEIITVTLREPTKDGGFTETREAMATPLVSSRSADMALLYLPSGTTMPRPLAVRHDKVIIGDHVWFLGEHGPLKNGFVAETGLSNNDTPHFVDVELPSVPRDNGAPVLNVCGELAGVALGPYGKNGRLRFLPIEDALESLGVTRVDLR